MCLFSSSEQDEEQLLLQQIRTNSVCLDLEDARLSPGQDNASLFNPAGWLERGTVNKRVTVLRSASPPLLSLFILPIISR